MGVHPCGCFVVEKNFNLGYPSYLYAVMGPSGAGKTTFLDVVSRRVLSSDPSASVCSFSDLICCGQIFKDKILQITFDGQDFNMRELGSYVPQEDALHGYLTVKDNIRYSALLSSVFSCAVLNGSYTANHLVRI